MSQTAPKGSRAVLATSVVAIVLSAVAIGLFLTSSASGGTSYRPATHTREFYIVTDIINFNETQLGIPHDIFSARAIEVNQGDNVVVHFYNTEDVSSGEHHTFTLAAYNINVDLAPGQKQDIKFTATQAGVFEYVCTYHLPTMRGELIVLPTG